MKDHNCNTSMSARIITLIYEIKIVDPNIRVKFVSANGLITSSPAIYILNLHRVGLGKEFVCLYNKILSLTYVQL